MNKKKIGIIGVTGSVGSSSVEVVAANSDLFDTVFVMKYCRMFTINRQYLCTAVFCFIHYKASCCNDRFFIRECLI